MTDLLIGLMLPSIPHHDDGRLEKARSIAKEVLPKMRGWT